MPAAEEVSMDAAISGVLSELDNISSLKEEQRMVWKAFLDGKDVSLWSRLSDQLSAFSFTIKKKSVGCFHGSIFPLKKGLYYPCTTALNIFRLSASLF